jgi:ketosteroid isomerase-like protein
MGSADLDLVRSINAAWERGDFFSSAEWAHPAIEYVVVDGPAPGTWIGLAGMTEGFREFLDAWEDLHVEVDKFRDLDDERVLVLLRRSARGKTSGLEIAETRTEGANLVHVLDEKLTRIVFYWDRSRAFADLGLAPEAGSPCA